MPPTNPPLSNSAQRVQQALAAHGLPLTVVELPQSTRTAVDAAAAIGCTVGQIAKSLIFRAKTSDRPVLVIASGSNRVDEPALAALLGEPLGKADADFVRARTGFVIGGVPPIGHTEPPVTFVTPTCSPTTSSGPPPARPTPRSGSPRRIWWR
jgi:prolyl-tRNA editing enzyme YbaK/EbsC (Cys-tRNA(Pro) deacylase)